MITDNELFLTHLDCPKGVKVGDYDDFFMSQLVYEDKKTKEIRVNTDLTQSITCEILDQVPQELYQSVYNTWLFQSHCKRYKDLCLTLSKWVSVDKEDFQIEESFVKQVNYHNKIILEMIGMSSKYTYGDFIHLDVNTSEVLKDENLKIVDDEIHPINSREEGWSL